MRIVTHHRLYGRQLALIVKAETRLHRIEIDRTTLGACRVQQLVQAVEIMQVRQHRGILRTQRRVAIEQHRPDLVVGQACMRIHHCLEEARTEEIAFGVEIQLCRHAQAIDMGIERTQTVRQDLGQHRDHAIGEVHRIAALVRLLVECRARRHIGRYVGDRDQQAPAFPGAFAEHRVIEITCIGTVDRDQWGGSQVNPTRFRRLGHFRP